MDSAAKSGGASATLLPLLLSLAQGFPSSPANAQDWPRFLGPRGDNTSPETGLLEEWNASGPPVVWEVPVGAGYSAPSVVENLLVLHHRLSDQEIVEALNPATGESVWRYGYPSRFRDPYGYNNGPRCTPLLTSNRCYTFGAEGKLLCLEQRTGRLVWQRDTGKDWVVPEAFFGVGSTPLLEGRQLIVMVGGMPNAGVVALDAATGRTLWQNVGKRTWHGKPKTGWRNEPPVDWAGEDRQASYASIVATTINGQRHLLAFMRQGLVSLDPRTGEPHFHFWFRSAVTESVNAMTPLAVDNSLFLSAAYYEIGSVLLRVALDGGRAEQVWRSTVLEMHWSTPVYHDGHLYAFSGRNAPDARFRCVELRSGKLKWERHEGWRSRSTKQPAVYGRGSAILVDGKLIVLGEGGLLGLFRTNPHKPEELARWQVPQLRYPCWTGPVLSRKRLFLRSEDRLLCLDVSRRD